MNPFSPLYYFKQNIGRAFALILVMSLALSLYLLGVYFSNSYDENLITIEPYKDFVIITPTDELESKTQFNELLKKKGNYENAGMIFNVNYFKDFPVLNYYFSGIQFYTIMNFRTGVIYPVFHSMDDFEHFTRVLGLPYSGGDNVIIMSDKLANHFNFHIGDIVKDDWMRISGFKNGLTLVNTYEKSNYGVPGAYSYFRLDSSFKPDDGDNPNAILLLREEAEEKAEIRLKQSQLEKRVDTVKQEFPDLVYIDYEYNLKDVEDTFASLWPMSIAILAIIGIVLIMISAGIFSVALEKRDFEFGVYKAIGLSKSRVLFKGIVEVLLLTLMSLILGVIIILLTVQSINNLLLFDNGQELYYYSDLAFHSYLAFHITITAVLLAMQIRKIIKSTVIRY